MCAGEKKSEESESKQTHMVCSSRPSNMSRGDPEMAPTPDNENVCPCDCEFSVCVCGLIRYHESSRFTRELFTDAGDSLS